MAWVLSFISDDSTRMPPTAAWAWRVLPEDSEKLAASTLPSMKSWTPRTPLGTGTPFTSFSVTPPVASRARANSPAIFCLV